MSLDLILEKASKEDIQMLKYHVRRIMIVLENNSGAFSDDIDALNLPHSIPKKVEENLDSALENFYSKIKKNQLLGKSHVNAFLAIVPPHDQEFRENYLIIQARLLLVAHKLNQFEGYGDFIERAFRDYRLLISEEKWSWLNRLPDFSRHISDLVDELGQARKKLSSNAKKRTLFFESLLKQYKKNKSVYTPRQVNRKIKTSKVLSKPFEIIESRISFEENETSYNEFLPEVPVVKNVGTDYEEHVADQITTERYFIFNLIAPNEVKKSLSLQATAAKSAANHIHRREKMLITDFSYLTKNEVSILIVHCLKKLDEDVHYICLLIMLFTGKSLEETVSSIKIVRLHNKPPFDDSAVFLFKPELPEHKVDLGLESILDRSKASVIQVLPSEIKKSIVQYKNQFKNVPRISEQIKKTIKSLNQSNTTNLTVSRITNYLVFYLNNKGVDSTDISLILGKGLRQESGSYYYQTNVGGLLTIHQGYIKELMKRSGHSINTISESTIKTVGSQLIVKQEKITQLFHLMIDELSHLRENNWKQIEQFHNLYVVYCIELLNLATGHRPVRNPYEDIKKFDLIAGTLFISDKEERNELAARVVALPNIALLQTKAYLKHLKNIETEISNISNESGKAIQDAICGEGPLFFFMNGLEVDPVIPSNLSDKLENIFPLPLNWHRHFMRTWLRKKGFNGQVVHAWMGHLSFSSTGFSRYSGLAIDNLNEISESINEFLTKEVMVVTVNPWEIK